MLKSFATHADNIYMTVLKETKMGEYIAFGIMTVGVGVSLLGVVGSCIAGGMAGVIMLVTIIILGLGTTR